MATTIEWTDGTWNPVTGCTKVSQGCKNCYAERVAERFWKDRKFTDVQAHSVRLHTPLRWKKPRMVFVNSMSDLFHEDVQFDFIDRVFAVMGIAKQHTFQVLTKRPERALEYLGEDRFKHSGAHGRILGAAHFQMLCEDASFDFPLPNVWLGVSVENQATADERIPLLLKSPAAVRFVSYEPALGPVDFANFLKTPGMPDRIVKPFSRPIEYMPVVGLDWIIVGGESGPGARAFDLQWARNTVQQCQRAQVPVFVKQMGAAPFDSFFTTDQRVHLKDAKGGNPEEWPANLRVQQFPSSKGVTCQS